MAGQVARFQRRTVSFVRRESRLGPRMQQVWDEHYARLVIDVTRPPASLSVAHGFGFDSAQRFVRFAPLVVELGSGH